MKRRPVSIIIPVYNGVDDIKLCMGSILKHTDLTLDAVILVNDKSPDEQIVPLLQSYVGEHIKLIDSPVNEGFSASVNKGMTAVDTDVILLNSDTIVTAGWVDKIYQCAYSAQEIGTVTPLSNSATLCSTPITCQDNKVPENVTIDEYAEIIERCSLHDYPRITVAVGFCMFIKREVIDCVGAFDAATFGRGYGEENDFCNRAEQLGYIHVMCDDTFIYHKGTGSFDTAEKQRLAESHDRILREWYPQQMWKNHLYCIHNPDQYIRDNIAIYTDLKNGKKNILYLLHSDFQEGCSDAVGGTQLHVKDLTFGLQDQFNIFVLARDNEKLLLTVYYGDQEKHFSFQIGPASQYPQYTNQKLKELFSNILSAFHIDLVHIHHTEKLSLDMFYCAHEMNIPVLATLHDYYYICPTIRLLDVNGYFCGGTPKDNVCGQCLYGHKEITPRVNFLETWRRENASALKLCSCLIVPSKAAKEVISQVYPELAENIAVIEHGISAKETEALKIESEKIRTDERVTAYIENLPDADASHATVMGWAALKGIDSARVKVYLQLCEKDGDPVYIPTRKLERADVRDALTGDGADYLQSGFSAHIPPYLALGKHVEARLILEYTGIYYTDGKEISLHFKEKEPAKGAFRVAFLGGLVPEKGSEIAYKLITKGNAGIHWYTFGTLGDERLAKLEQKNLTKIGTYRREEISDLLQGYKIDLVCIFSTWAETFCYTLSEAWANGIPVFGMDIGAVGDRIRQTGAGCVFPVGIESGKILERIDSLRDDTAAYQKLKANAQAISPKTLEQMCADYAALYNKYAITECHYGGFSPRYILDALCLPRDKEPASKTASVALPHENALIHWIKQKLWVLIDRIPGMYGLYKKIAG